MGDLVGQLAKAPARWCDESTYEIFAPPYPSVDADDDPVAMITHAFQAGICINAHRKSSVVSISGR